VIEKGQTLVNPVTGERMTFVETAAENGGERVVIELHAKGMPNPFRLAVIANAYFDTVRLPVIPAWMQKAASSVGATAGKAMGYGPTYVPEPAAVEQFVPQAA
jgi:hypothetical protein